MSQRHKGADINVNMILTVRCQRVKNYLVTHVNGNIAGEYEAHQEDHANE